MYHKQRHRKHFKGGLNAAFTLLELSVSIAIIALLMSGGLVVLSDIAVKTQVNNSEIRLDEIADALEAYRVRNGRLPCPASRADLPNAANFGKEVNSGDCTYTVAPTGTTRIETVASSGLWVLVGVLPVRDLLLRDEYMNDGFGDRITYAVAQPLTDDATFEDGIGTITINDGAGNEIINDGAYVLLSHGKTGEGAYRFASGTARLACGATNLDSANCNGDTTFVDAPYNDGSGALAANFYDDHIRWQSNRRYDEPIAGSGGITPDFTGFRLDGASGGHHSGRSVSTGDVNGDGIADIIIGAIGGNGGQTFVVFGKATGIDAHPKNLSTLDGTDGFRLEGVSASDQTGYSVDSGDINNDGFDDIIIGGPRTDYTATDSGSVYVVFGKASGWATTTVLSTLNGTTGFRLDGAAASGLVGFFVHSADINNDGFDDIITGAPYANTNAGYTYVVFGKAGVWAATTALSTLNGTTGFRLDGIANSQSGYAISSGDINNDGFDDIIVGAWVVGAGAGATYVVFGKSGAWAATTALSALNGTTGFRLDGANANDYSAISVSSGDINNDGFDDVIIGAFIANSSAGYTYVTFGKAGAWAASTNLSTLNGTTGFRLDGVSANERSGGTVSSGDINNDGFNDVIIGALQANSNAGVTYVVFGKAGAWAATTALSTLNGTTGFRLDGVNANDYSGTSVNSGDINNDGYDDVIIGAESAAGFAGYTYGIYGNSGAWAATNNLDTLSIP